MGTILRVSLEGQKNSFRRGKEQKMEINSNYYLSSMLYSSASSASSSTMDNSSSFTDMLTASSSLAGQMAGLGAESLGEAPDFGSMSLEEFQEHLMELQATLASSGIDTSDLPDPAEMTVEELEALQEEMSSRGNNPPPPPPMEMMNLNFVDYSSITEEMFNTLFGTI